MTDPKLDEVRSWLIKAQQDLDASAWLLEFCLDLPAQASSNSLSIDEAHRDAYVLTAQAG